MKRNYPSLEDRLQNKKRKLFPTTILGLFFIVVGVTSAIIFMSKDCKLIDSLTFTQPEHCKAKQRGFDEAYLNDALFALLGTVLVYIGGRELINIKNKRQR